MNVKSRCLFNLSLVRLSDAITLRKEEKPKLALAKLNRALALRPDYFALFKERAEAHAMLCNFHAAIINLKRVIALKEEEREAVTLRLGQVYYQYGVSLASEKKHAEALELFEKAEIYDPTNEKTLTRR